MTEAERREWETHLMLVANETFFRNRPDLRYRFDSPADEAIARGDHRKDGE